MRKLRFYLVTGFLIVGSTGTAGFAQSSSDPTLSTNFLFPTRGSVQILHKEWTRPVSAAFGTEISEKDQMILNGAEALFVCSDMTIRYLSHIAEPFPCTPHIPTPPHKPRERIIGSNVRGVPKLIPAPYDNTHG